MPSDPRPPLTLSTDEEVRSTDVAPIPTAERSSRSEPVVVSPGEPVVRAEGLGKKYVIGEREPYKTFRGSLAGLVRRDRRGSVPLAREEFWALRDVSFDVAPNEILGIIGHNGAGKSTLLKLISRVTSPTTGRAVLHGRASALLEVGTGFHPELTGRENVFLNGSVLGMSQREIASKFDGIVDFAEVAQFIDTPIKRYSSGMQVRLAFAVAAFLEPEILIVDEVLAVGDAAFQRKCMGRLGISATEGRTVLFVSHNLTAIRTLCTRAIVLDHGAVVFEGSPGNAIDHYLVTKVGQRDGWDLAHASRPGLAMGGKVRFESLALEGASSSGSIGVGDDLALRIGFEVTAPVEDTMFVLNLSTVEDVLVAQSVSTSAFPPIPRLEPGRYEIRATARAAMLQVGKYQVALGARSGSGLEDQVEDAGLVELIESMDLEFPFFGSSGGYLRLPVEWTRPDQMS